MTRTRRRKLHVSLFKVLEMRAQLMLFADDPDVYDGAEVAVQLVGRRLQEEKMLALAEYLGQELR